MFGSTDKILQALEAEQIRRLNLTKEDLQKSYRKLAEQNFPDDQRIRFIADLGACKDAAYHYRLICKDWEEDKKLHLESSFDQHGREGLAFLLVSLDCARHEHGTENHPLCGWKINGYTNKKITIRFI